MAESAKLTIIHALFNKAAHNFAFCWVHKNFSKHFQTDGKLRIKKPVSFPTKHFIFRQVWFPDREFITDNNPAYVKPAVQFKLHWVCTKKALHWRLGCRHYVEVGCLAQMDVSHTTGLINTDLSCYWCEITTVQAVTGAGAQAFLTHNSCKQEHTHTLSTASQCGIRLTLHLLQSTANLLYNMMCKQGSEWGGMDWYGIPAVPWSPEKDTGTFFWEKT